MLAGSLDLRVLEPLADEDIATLRIGDPDDALAQCQRWVDAGTDQIVFGVGPAKLEETLEMIRLMGEHVIPKLDTDPEFRTDKFKKAAAGKK